MTNPERLYGFASVRVDRWNKDSSMQLAAFEEALQLPGIVGIKLAHAHQQFINQFTNNLIECHFHLRFNLTSGGDVEIFGHNLDTEQEAAKACLGIVPQEINLNLWETVGNIVFNQAGYYGIGGKLARERVEKYLRELRLWDRRNDTARSLSGGMKRRLMIARALVHEPQLLILDEPTAGVDIEIRRSMWDYLRKINDAGTTIILTTRQGKAV